MSRYTQRGPVPPVLRRTAQPVTPENALSYPQTQAPAEPTPAPSIRQTAAG